jgi:hypothetical protein
MFNLYLAQQLPQVKIVSATAKASGDGTFDITAVVTNSGLMPTALEIAKRVKMVRPDFLSVELGKGQAIVRPQRGGQTRGQAPGQAPIQTPSETRATEEIGWLKPGEQKTVTWKVKGPGQITVRIGSTRGGVDQRTLEVK